MPPAESFAQRLVFDVYVGLPELRRPRSRRIYASATSFPGVLPPTALSWVRNRRAAPQRVVRPFFGLLIRCLTIATHDPAALTKATELFMPGRAQTRLDERSKPAMAWPFVMEAPR